MNNILTPVFYRGIIYVLTIAIVMLVFEILLFKLIILPENEKFINNNLKKLNSIVKNDEYDQNVDIVSKILENSTAEKNVEDVLNVKSAISDTINKREEDLIGKINTDLIIFMSLIIILFTFLIFICYYKIRDVQKDIMPIISVSILTIMILIFFQYTMYIYGHKFLYTTDIELKDNIMNYISSSTYLKP